MQKYSTLMRSSLPANYKKTTQFYLVNQWCNFIHNRLKDIPTPVKNEISSRERERERERERTTLLPLQVRIACNFKIKGNHLALCVQSWPQNDAMLN